jgi:chondroitin AC lyase
MILLRQFWLNSLVFSLATISSLASADSTAIGFPDIPENGKISMEQLTDREIVIRRVKDTWKEEPNKLGTALRFAHEQNEDGSWSDLSFSPTVVSASSAHMNRVFLLSVEYLRASEDGDLDDAEVLRQAALKGFRYWLDFDPEINHYFGYWIKQPMNAVGTLMILQDDLSSEDWEMAERMIRRADFRVYSEFMNSGQNLIWRAESMALLGLILGDDELVHFMLSEIAKAMEKTTAEGVQYDYSYHMHGPLLASFSYGHGFSRWTSKLIYWTDGTDFSFPPESVALVEAFILEHQQWVMWGRAVDLSTRGRSIARNAGPIGLLDAPVDYLLRVETPRRAEIERLRERMNNAETTPNSPALTGNRMFWASDFMVHREQDWYASARLHSTRTKNSDKPHNGESLKGHYLGDGTTFLNRDGTEYFGIQPLWNWQQIPGTTVVQNGEFPLIPRLMDRKGETSFVGGVSNETTGVFVGDFKRDTLSARKSWFFPGGYMVALGSCIGADEEAPVYTTVQQSFAEDGMIDQFAEEVSVMEGEPFYHGGFVYSILPGSDPAMAKVESRKGNWQDISKISPNRDVEGNVFTLWIDHGSRPKGAVYSYLAAPEDSNELGEGIRFVNNCVMQAVWVPEKKWLGAVFYQWSSLEHPEIPLNIEVDRPCAVILKMEGDRLGQLWISDPSQTAESIRIAIRLRNMSWHAEVDFPVDPYAGSPVTLPFSLGD